MRNTSSPVTEPTQTESLVMRRQPGDPPVRMVATTFRRTGSMRETVPKPFEFEDHAEPNPYATSQGAGPTRIRLTTRRRAGLTTSIRLNSKSSIQSRPRPKAMPQGDPRSRSRPLARFVAGLIRVSVPAPKFATKNERPTAMLAHGWLPVTIRATSVGGVVCAALAPIVLPAAASRSSVIRVRISSSSSSTISYHNGAKP
jgi:hypothetical protein